VNLKKGRRRSDLRDSVRSENGEIVRYRFESDSEVTVRSSVLSEFVAQFDTVFAEDSVIQSDPGIGHGETGSVNDDVERE
jgi:hypothetical protein